MKTLLVIFGPTGVGKTELSLRLAEFFSCPIVNSDSRQLYRDIPIGTAAPTAGQLRRVKHYFVGTLGLEESYSAARFEQEALRVIDRELQERDVLILSGGSMMYIDAVCHGIDDIPTIEPEVRQSVLERYAEMGLEPLLRELRLLDPVYYDQVDKRNTRRVLHGLEVCYQTGRTFTSFRTGRRKERPFRLLRMGLLRERNELFARINARAEQMVADGLLDEARRVLPFRHLNALNTVGFKEMFQVLDGQWTLDFALARMQKNTRVYAKKQLTWFRREGGDSPLLAAEAGQLAPVRWFHPDDEAGIRSWLVESLQ